MLENIIARNPFTFAGELSFTFKNETRVQFKKYAADYVFDQMDTDEKVFETVGDPLVDISLAGGSGLFISYGQHISGKSKTFAIFQYLLFKGSYRIIRMMIWHILYISWHCKETAALTC